MGERSLSASSLVPSRRAAPPVAVVFTGADPGYIRIQAGFAACLQESLYRPLELTGEVDSGGKHAETDRADLILQLLLHSVDAASPSFAHLLMGFHVEDGPQGVQLSSSPRLASPL